MDCVHYIETDKPLLLCNQYNCTQAERSKQWKAKDSLSHLPD